VGLKEEGEEEDEEDETRSTNIILQSFNIKEKKFLALNQARQKKTLQSEIDDLETKRIKLLVET
jgi:hypothetical protein